jgi:hypothetical protein
MDIEMIKRNTMNNLDENGSILSKTKSMPQKILYFKQEK